MAGLILVGPGGQIYRPCSEAPAEGVRASKQASLPLDARRSTTPLRRVLEAVLLVCPGSQSLFPGLLCFESIFGPRSAGAGSVAAPSGAEAGLEARARAPAPAPPDFLVERVVVVHGSACSSFVPARAMYADFAWESAPLSSWSAPAGACVAYLLGVVVLRALVPAGGIKGLDLVLVAHNGCLSLLSAAMFLGCLWELGAQIRGTKRVEIA